MRRIVAITVLALLGVLPLWAQQSETLVFTRIERNPRTAALAGAGAASVRDVAYASFQNAAKVPFYAGKADFAAGYHLWSLEKASSIHAGAAYRLGVVGLSFGGIYQFNDPALQLNLGVGARLAHWLSVGVNLRLAQQTLFPGQAISGFNADVMLLARASRSLSFAAGVVNIGNNIKDSYSNDYPQPASLKLAADYLLAFARVHTLEFMLDMDYFLFSKGISLSVGAEYAYNNMLFVRAGYRAASVQTVYPSHLALGLGFQFAGVRLEASWLTASQRIGNSLSLGLGYRF